MGTMFPDVTPATTTSTGTITLTNDLAGTADAPVVARVAGTTPGAEGLALLATATALAARTSLVTPKAWTATRNPTVTDDSSAGVSVGDDWTNTSARSAWRCYATSVGAAVWVAMGGVLAFPGPIEEPVVVTVTTPEGTYQGDLNSPAAVESPTWTP